MTGIIILAAGASTRLGRAKQILAYKDKSLMENSVDAALDSKIGPVVVVLGANENEIRPYVEKEAVVVLLNKNWKEGIASSIRCGVNYLQEYNRDLENVILMVCDQPYVDKNLLISLTNAKLTTNESIIACAYKETIGVPALFDKKYFPELLSLQGEDGGKKVLLRHIHSIASIHFPKGNIDIDTEDDYEALPA